jgi:hypothetical protein
VNDLMKAGVDLQQVLVNWQLHVLRPPASKAAASGTAGDWIWTGTSGFDVMGEFPDAVVPQS